MLSVLAQSHHQDLFPNVYLPRMYQHCATRSNGLMKVNVNENAIDHDYHIIYNYYKRWKEFAVEKRR